MIIDWVIRIMEVLGAPGVGLAVFLENIFPPIPSELILPLAGFTASQGNFNVWAALVASVIGSVTGAYLLYWVGQAFGADRLRRIADWMWLVDAKDVDDALAWFDKYGTWSVFFGRLIPGVRSLISIPAGIDRMNPLTFGLLTTAGSLIWNSILIWAGVQLGERWETVTRAFESYSSVVYILVALIVVSVLLFLIRRHLTRRATASADPGKD
ncbi:Inner membrane protein YqjA [Corynebacterium faecale]|uniref:DedA family protein n=1 Tax=Corynebacterium faecale TaxID=1758466 RepID=UPI0025B38E55|nr:DedA family protein [Corynebacterium faecale]WJY91603.1 Inner membrane protein YqjA [Corynebacterium faecale]